MNEAALPQSTVHIAQADPDGILLVIHAGAGNRGKKDTPERRAQVEQDLNRALEAGYALLEQGAPAEDAVCAAIRVMEDAPEFNAGRGAALTSEGIVSMDSCLMTGVDGEVGSACGLTTSKNPINVARAIKEKTKHVMFAKPGNDLLKEWGIELCDSEYFITPARQESLREAQSNGDEWEKHGTIGAVAVTRPATSLPAPPPVASPTRCRDASAIRLCRAVVPMPTTIPSRSPAPVSVKRSSRKSLRIRFPIVFCTPRRSRSRLRRRRWMVSPVIMEMAV